MHEGKEVFRILEANGKTVANLARAAGVKWAAAKKYVEAETIGPGAWDTCAKGLRALDIDPELIRPVAGRMMREKTEILSPMVSDFSPSQLERLKRIITASESARLRLHDYIEGFLAGKK